MIIGRDPRKPFSNDFLGSRRSKNKRTFSIKKILIVCLAIGSLFILGGFLVNKFFNVARVDLVFDSYACGDENQIENSLSIKKRLIFWVNDDEVSKKLKTQYSCINEVVFSKYLPNKIAILISGRKPIATVVTGRSTGNMINISQIEATAASSAATIDFSVPEPQSDKFFVDESGFLFFQTSGDVNLPLVFINQDLSLKMSLGQNIGVGLKNAIEVINKFGLNPKLVKIESDGILVVVGEKGQKVILSLDNELLKQLASLQLILQKNKIDSKRIESIDLRFSKPVVIYSK